MKRLIFWLGNWTLGILFLILQFGTVQAGLVEYDLIIETREVNFTGRPVRALTINGNIPGPTLTLTEGDRARIRVHNRLDTETSIHWHGILLPNREDGVSYLTTPPLLPGKTHIFEFPVIQSGTYWYHSHTGLQEQRGRLRFSGDPSPERAGAGSIGTMCWCCPTGSMRTRRR